MADIPLEKPKMSPKSPSSHPEGVSLAEGMSLDKSQMQSTESIPEIVPEGVERAVEKVIGSDIPKKTTTSGSRIVVANEKQIPENKITSKTIGEKEVIKNISREDLIKSLFIIAKTLGYAQVTNLLFEVVKGIEPTDKIAVKIDSVKQK